VGKKDGFFKPVIKDREVIAKRFVITMLVTELADSVALETAGARDQALAMRKRALDELVALGWTPHDLETAEQRLAMGLHTGRVDQKDSIAAMWRLECAGVLAWALGLEAAIGPLDHKRLRAHCPADAAAFRALVASATVRPLNTIMSARHEWSMRWFPMEPTPPSEERSQTLERVRALRWLTEADQVELSATPVLAGG
jgi:hypothetical protein